MWALLQQWMAMWVMFTEAAKVCEPVLFLLRYFAKKPCPRASLANETLRLSILEEPLITNALEQSLVATLPLIAYAKRREGLSTSTSRTNTKDSDSNLKDAAVLLLLLSFFGDSGVTRSMLHRGACDRKSWGVHGTEEMVTACADGLTERLVTVLKNTLRLNWAIGELEGGSLIEYKTYSSNSSVYIVTEICRRSLLPQLSDPAKAYWKRQRINFICHIFPHHSSLEKSFGDVGRSQLLHIEQLVQDFNGGGNISNFSSDSLIGTLHAASRFSIALQCYDPTTWRQITVHMLKDSIPQDEATPYWVARAAQRKSVQARMFGDLDGSDAVLRTALQSVKDSQINYNRRMRAEYGRMLRSLAENQVQRQDLSCAWDTLGDWSPIDPQHPSPLENLVQRSIESAQGRILQYLGNFNGALDIVTTLLSTSHGRPLLDGDRLYLLSRRLDLLCELGRQQEAENIVRGLTADIDALSHRSDRVWDKLTKAKRFRISVAALRLNQDQYEIAEHCLEDLRNSYMKYEDPADLDMVNKRLHLRLCLIRAMISHKQCNWADAESRRAEAFNLIRLYGLNNYESTRAIILLSIARVRAESVPVMESCLALQILVDTLVHLGPQHWFPGMNQWLLFVLRSFEGNEVLSATDRMRLNHRWGLRGEEALQVCYNFTTCSV
ncbi:MAG: hypothetical protein M1816_004373 [Peltula sp. TS41687]|nr:MAG: hypothetical protein M1816_004373 [Peltula sp. TS41687]